MVDKDQLELDLDLPPVEKELSFTSPSAAKITGYRNLTAGELAWINTIKGAEIELGAVLNNVRELVDGVDRDLVTDAEKKFRDGFMLLVRSVARPEDPFK